jgi:exonuclease VII small subunit
MNLERAVQIFYSGAQLRFGCEEHIEARDLLRKIIRRGRGPTWREFNKLKRILS